jgi:IS6 family transposase
MSSQNPADFKWRHFRGEVILECVRWYCKYGVSYRNIEEMMSNRGLSIDHTCSYRWVQEYAPEIRKRLTWYSRRYSRRWHLDETYVKVKGKWCYLYRAIDEQENTIDFYLSPRRNAKEPYSLYGKI